MTFESLKQTCAYKVSGKTFNSGDALSDRTNRILTLVLLISIIQKHIKGNSKMESHVDSLANEYIELYKPIVESLEEKYITYKSIKRLVEKYNLNSLMRLTENQYQELLNLYENKQEKVVFNPYRFSQFMYKVESLNYAEEDKLRKTHFNIICPIVKYYISYASIKNEDVDVEAAEGSFPGKEIKLAITNVNYNKIISDINLRKIGEDINKQIYSVSLTDDGFVKIVVL